MYPELSEKEKIVQALRGPQFNREEHGALFDRGSADSYYGRPRDPHYYPRGSYCGEKRSELTPVEIEEYNAGYNWNEQYGDKKSWD